MDSRLADLLTAPRRMPFWLVVGFVGLIFFPALDLSDVLALLWISALCIAVGFAEIGRAHV